VRDIGLRFKDGTEREKRGGKGGHGKAGAKTVKDGWEK